MQSLLRSRVLVQRVIVLSAAVAFIVGAGCLLYPQSAGATPVATCRASGFIDGLAQGGAGIANTVISSPNTAACLGENNGSTGFQKGTYVEFVVPIKGNPTSKLLDTNKVTIVATRGAGTLTENFMVLSRTESFVSKPATSTIDVGVLLPFTAADCQSSTKPISNITIKVTPKAGADIGPDNGTAQEPRIDTCDFITQQQLVIQPTAALDLSKTSTQTTTPGGGGTDVCSGAGAFSWALCPILHLLIVGIGFFQSVITQFLAVSPLSLSSDANANPTYTLWKAATQFTNLGFAGAVLLLIAGEVIQNLPLGVSNYNIKKYLPKLLVGAAFANTSYFIIAFIIGAFNVAGDGIANLMIDIVQTGGGGDSGIGLQWLTAIPVALLVGFFAKGALIPLVLPLIGTAFLILTSTIICLFLRQMLIIAMVIISPLAPFFNFKKWLRFFISLMVMYPLIILLFAAGKIFGLVISAGNFSFSNSGTPLAGASQDLVIAGLEVLAYTAPLAALPAVLANAGKLTATIQQGATNAAQTIGRSASGLGAIQFPTFGTERMRRFNSNLREGSGLWRAGYALPTIFSAGAIGNQMREARKNQQDLNRERLASRMLSGAPALLANEYTRAEAFGKVQGTEDKETKANEQLVARGIYETGAPTTKEFLDDVGRYLRKESTTLTDIRTGKDYDYTKFFRQNPHAFNGVRNLAASSVNIKLLETLLGRRNASGNKMTVPTGEDPAIHDRRMQQAMAASTANKAMIDKGASYLFNSQLGIAPGKITPDDQGVRATMLQRASTLSNKALFGGSGAYLETLIDALGDELVPIAPGTYGPQPVPMTPVELLRQREASEPASKQTINVLKKRIDDYRKAAVARQDAPNLGQLQILADKIDKVAA